MKRHRPAGSKGALALALLVIAFLAGGAALLRTQQRSAGPPHRGAGERPALTLLTSLPLVFGERLSLQSGGSKALTALETRYTVVPIAVADPASLNQAPMLLMAHAAAQPAENLVALDSWVRGGGKLLLLADPALEWESERPLGDPLRPSPMFPDTGLVSHWGLRLDSPEQGGVAERQLGGRPVRTRSPGQLFGGCTISADRFVADCKLGRGRAIVVADADFLDIDSLEDSSQNLNALLVMLAQLETR